MKNDFYLVLLSILVTYASGKVFKSFSIWMVDILSWKSCLFDEQNSRISNSSVFYKDFSCSNEATAKACSETGGDCHILVDGFYIEIGLNIVFGICWYFLSIKVVQRLQKLPLSDWHVLSNRNQVTIQNEENLPLNL
jgi:MFS transporter, PAT family, solute carrier family 33 (acetyl-CoA transportor), member 1